MENLKTLEINGITIQYKIFNNPNNYSKSEFYIGTTTRTYKKYIFFGKVITEIKPKHVFTIFKDIESFRYTKKQVRRWVEYKLTLLKRAEEIKKDDLI